MSELFVQNLDPAEKGTGNATSELLKVETSRTGHRAGFDSFKPANPALARKHRQSRKVRRLNDQQDCDYERCECCEMPVDAPRMPTCCGLSEMNELGPGFPMYYMNIKFVITLLCVGVGLVGLPCVILNYYDVDKDDDSGIFMRKRLAFNIGEANSDELAVHQGVQIAYMLIILISYHLWRRHLDNAEEQIDMNIVTPSDYTLMVTGLPKNTNEEEVTAFFQEHGRVDGKPAKVVKVNFAYKIREYVEGTREEIELIQKIKVIEAYQEQYPGQLPPAGRCRKQPSLAKLRTKLARVQTMLEHFEKETEAGVGRDLLVGTAFVTFSTQAEARAVEERFGKPTILWMWDVVFQYLFGRWCHPKESQILFRNKKPLHASIAPEPSDIFWENLEVSFKGRLRNTLKTYLVTLVALGVSFGMVLGFSLLKKNAGGEGPEKQVNSVWPAILIVVINFVLARLVRYFSVFEKHHTYTDYTASVALKLTFAQFLNTAVITLVVEWNETEQWFDTEGLVADVVTVMLSNAFVHLLIYVVSPAFCIRRLKMHRAVRRPGITQGELNQVFEPPEVDMAQRYANLMKNVLLVLFYTPIIPGGLIIVTLGILLQYWVEKCMLLRRHARPNRLSGDLATTMIGLVPWAVLLYSIMNFLFVARLNEDEAEIPFIWMFCVLAYIFLPIELVLGCFKSVDLDTFEKEYPGDNFNKAALDFYDDYDRENPVTQQTGWERYLALKEQEAGPGADLSMFRSLFDKHAKQTRVVAKGLHNYAVNRDSLRKAGQKKMMLPGLGQAVQSAQGEEQEDAKNLAGMKQLILGGRKVQNTYAAPSYSAFRAKGVFGQNIEALQFDLMSHLSRQVSSQPPGPAQLLVPIQGAFGKVVPQS